MPSSFIESTMTPVPLRAEIVVGTAYVVSSLQFVLVDLGQNGRLSPQRPNYRRVEWRLGQHGPVEVNAVLSLWSLKSR